jgi:DNA-binding response OmpR family regulator
MNALVVTDQEYLYRRLSGMLREFAIHAEPNTDPKDAQDQISRQGFDMVLLDCDLDHSQQLVEAIRGNPENQNTFLFALASGFSKQSELTRAGANLVLRKPINWQLAKRSLKAAQAMIIRERRIEIREKAKTLVQLSFVAQKMETLLIDLSETGMAVQSRHALKVNEPVHIRFSLPGTLVAVQCKGRVVRATKDGQMGIAFTSVDDSNRSKIADWIRVRQPRRSQIIQN